MLKGASRVQIPPSPLTLDPVFGGVARSHGGNHVSPVGPFGRLVDHSANLACEGVGPNDAGKRIQQADQSLIQNPSFHAAASVDERHGTCPIARRPSSEPKGKAPPVSRAFITEKEGFEPSRQEFTHLTP